jgi:hypothetical protein
MRIWRTKGSAGISRDQLGSAGIKQESRGKELIGPGRI